MVDGEAQKSDYNLVPYESHPFEHSTPENLHTLGRLFGLSPKHFSACRVLELGCASGGNIIPLAENYPNCEFLGIDLSSRQIEDGQEIISSLDLNNITLKTESILNIDSSAGKFDYIIAHGVYSWVPEEVQQSLLRVCKENLAEDGLAYVSYNTLPGWNMLKSIRDMMEYHVRSVEDVSQKVPSAKAILKFVHDTVADSDSAYSVFLKQELDTILNASDYYIFHEHLENENLPCYFHEFMEQAKGNDLDYVADTDLASMLLANFPKEVVDNLSNAKDIVVTEQYMDFIRNRRFRSTVLCHGDKATQIKRNLTKENIRNLYFSCPITKADRLSEENLQTGKIVNIEVRNTKLQLTDRASKLIMQAFASQLGKPISLPDLATKVKEAGATMSQAEIENFILDKFNLLKMVFKNIVHLHSSEGLQINEISSKPKVNKFVRYLADKDIGKLTNARHQSVDLPKVERIVLKYLDGERSVDALAELLKTHVANGEIKLAQEGETVTDEELIHKALLVYVETVLKKLRGLGMLQA